MHMMVSNTVYTQNKHFSLTTCQSILMKESDRLKKALFFPNTWVYSLANKL